MSDFCSGETVCDIFEVGLCGEAMSDFGLSGKLWLIYLQGNFEWGTHVGFCFGEEQVCLLD